MGSFPRVGLRSGFTIVELLVVIVVIGILAAISIVAYNGIQDRAKRSVISSDLQNFSRKVALFYVDYGRYPHTSSLNDLDYHVSYDAYPDTQWGFDYCPSLDQSEWILVALTQDSIMYVSSNNPSPKEYSHPDFDVSENDYIASPCYSGTTYSAADRAGLGQIGYPSPEDGRPVGGLSGKGNGEWRPWTRGGRP